MMTRLRIWWLFYRSFAAAGIIISISCAIWFRTVEPGTINGIAVIKLFSDAAIHASLRYFDLRRPIFFYNLHYSPRELWIAAFTLDTAILLLLLLIVCII